MNSFNIEEFRMIFLRILILKDNIKNSLIKHNPQTIFEKKINFLKNLIFFKRKKI